MKKQIKKNLLFALFCIFILSILFIGAKITVLNHKDVFIKERFIMIDADSSLKLNEEHLKVIYNISGVDNPPPLAIWLTFIERKMTVLEIEESEFNDQIFKTPKVEIRTFFNIKIGEKRIPSKTYYHESLIIEENNSF